MRIKTIVTSYIMLFCAIQNNLTLPIRINRGYILSGITLATSLALFLSKSSITIQDANFEQSICTERDVTTDTITGLAGIGVILFLSGKAIAQLHIENATDDLSQHITNAPA